MLVARNAKLGSDVQISSADTWVDGPSLDLGPGTWFIYATGSVVRATTAAVCVWQMRLTNGSTHYASGQATSVSNNPTSWQIALATVVVLTQQTTVKIQAACSAGASTSTHLKAATSSNSSGNNVTQITAFADFPLPLVANTHVGTSSSSSTTTFSMTTSTPSALLIVDCTHDNGATGGTVTSVTFDGTNLTKDTAFDAPGNIRVERWYLKAPAAKTADVIVNWSGTPAAAVAVGRCLIGVDQTTTFRSTATHSSGSNNPHIGAISNVDDLVVDFVGTQSRTSPAVPGTGQTVQANAQHSGGGGHVVQYLASSKYADVL